MDHAGVMNNCDEKAQRIGLARLNKVERVVVLVSRANFEIELGGLDTFYYNSAGDEAVSTVDALEAVGAIQAAFALKKANALFPGGVPSANRQRRFVGLEAIRKLRTDPLRSLENEISDEDPSIFSRLCIYIETHSKELKEHCGRG